MSKWHLDGPARMFIDGGNWCMINGLTLEQDVYVEPVDAYLPQIYLPGPATLKVWSETPWHTYYPDKELKLSIWFERAGKNMNARTTVTVHSGILVSRQYYEVTCIPVPDEDDHLMTIKQMGAKDVQKKDA